MGSSITYVVYDYFFSLDLMGRFHVLLEKVLFTCDESAFRGVHSLLAFEN